VVSRHAVGQRDIELRLVEAIIDQLRARHGPVVARPAKEDDHFLPTVSRTHIALHLGVI